jgi:cobalamin biosynthesis protein CobT
MIVLSDGQPVDGRSPEALLKKVASDIDKSKSIDLYSIGIGTASVEHFYQKTSVIADATQLEDALLTLLKQSLT